MNIKKYRGIFNDTPVFFYLDGLTSDSIAAITS